ncbi:sensor histidine kinase [Solimonas marina]|uniref:histidine kinase n=1 Tax=Solimonas marina TaxID=2714601 RepID=A0A970BBR6_9GAMM|nr:ATP-binding protein [Solimonas marina]NKF24741.1 hypothetical protein [Solimonas marina]
MMELEVVLLDSLIAAISGGLAVAGFVWIWPWSWARSSRRLAGCGLLLLVALMALGGAVGWPRIGLYAGLPLTVLLTAILLRESLRRRRTQGEHADDKLREELMLREDSEQRLRKALSQYRRTAADFEQFAYAASHDLQSPLHNVQGFARLLEQRCASLDDPQIQLFVRQIVDGVTQTQTLVEALLQLSRIGRRDAHFQTRSLGLAFAQACERLAGEIAASDAQIVEPPWPQIEADHALLSQLFQNLIGNALKYQPPGQVPRLEISARRERDDWHLVFTDNGIGIAADQVDHIFAPLQRLHSQAQFSGSGMGLAICRKIASFHDGEIWAEPHEGGAQIHVLLPRRARPQGRASA